MTKNPIGLAATSQDAGMRPSHPCAAAYLRRSTTMQSQERSIPEQLKGVRKAALDMGLELLEEFIFSDSSSGMRRKGRHGLEALLKAAKDGTLKRHGVTHVLVWATDRAARSLLDALTVEDELSRAGIQLYSVSEGFDVTSIGGKEEFVLRSLFAEMHNKLRTADKVRGQRRLIKEGGYIGAAPYGYILEKGSRLRICDSEAATIRRMFERFLSGWSTRAIIKDLNAEGVPGPRGQRWINSTAIRILKSEVYAGIKLYGSDPKSAGRRLIGEGNHHPAIVETETFIRAQGMFRDRSRCRKLTSTVRHFYLLGGMRLLCCGVCGLPLRGNSYTPKNKYGPFHYYKCTSRSTTGKDCGLPGVRCELVDQAVVAKLIEMVSNPARVREAWKTHAKDLAPQSAPLQQELRASNAQLVEISRRLDRLVLAVEEGKGAAIEIVKRVKSLGRERDCLRVRQRELAVRLNTLTQGFDFEGLLTLAADFQSAFEGMRLEERKMLVRQFVSGVRILGKTEFEITLRFFPTPVRVGAGEDFKHRRESETKN